MERQLHINLLELQAILFALMAFKDIQNQLVTIRTDNTTCVAYINHQGDTVSTALSKIAENLWNLCLKRNIHLRAEHIPGTQNLIADQASRRKLDRHDWKLLPELFMILDKIWDPIRSICSPAFTIPNFRGIILGCQTLGQKR